MHTFYNLEQERIKSDMENVLDSETSKTTATTGRCVCVS